MGQRVTHGFMPRQLAGLSRWKILCTLPGINRPNLFCRSKTGGKWKILREQKRQKSKLRDTETILVAINTQRCTYFRRLSFTKLIDVLVLSINWTNAGYQLPLLILSAGTRLDCTFPFIDIKFKIWHFGPYVTWLETPCSSKAKYFTDALRSHLEWTATIIKDSYKKK